MRVVNPLYVAPSIEADKVPAHEKHAAAIVAEVKRATDRAAVSFDEIRAALGLDADALPDGAIHQAAIDAGMKVDATPATPEASK